MALAIRGVNKYIKNLSLSNYSLATQIIIINLLTSIIGFVFLFLFNYSLLSNNKNIDNQIGDIKNDLYQITNYLSNNSIIRVPQFNEEDCEITKVTKELIFQAVISKKCLDNKKISEDKILNKSKPQLDPTSTQKYLFDNYLNGNNFIRVYNDSRNIFADTEDIYIFSDVVEVDIAKPSDKLNLFTQYKENYLKYFNYFQQYFNRTEIQSEISKNKADILKLETLINTNPNGTAKIVVDWLVKETIAKQSNLSYVFEDDTNNIVLINSSPILKNDNIYGVVLVSGTLSQENDDAGFISFILINFFIFFILIMFFLSMLFSRSIIFPIKILSKIVRSERDKSKKNINKFVYPKRRDEIGILSEDIRSMSEDLKKRIDEIESFAADVSHELKNPLASLKSANELLIDNKIATEKKTLLLKNMQKDIQRMNTLITDISSYTLTQIEIDDELFFSFDIVDFLQKFLQSYPSNLKNIKLKFIFEKKPSMVYANKNKLAQVFQNLIDNSLSYAPRNSEILIEQKIINKNIVIILSDQGPGISRNFRKKIFERFYTDRSSEQIKHSGLGLSIAKKIIENFSGSLELNTVKSQHHLGACFEINLPLKE